MSKEEKWYNILVIIDEKSRIFALIAIISNSALLGTILSLPIEHRIYGVFTFAAVLLATLAVTWQVRELVPTKDHNQPNLEFRVVALKDKLIEGRFLPELIIAIPRGGLAVAGILARKLGHKNIVPVISLCPTGQSGSFDNAFNNISFKREDFDIAGSEPVKVLIVDDICRSGRTLDGAREYVNRSIASRNFLVETAAISFYETTNRAVAPSFFVDRPREAIQDASGDVEPMPA